MRTMTTNGAVVMGLVLAASAQAADKIKVTPVEIVETRAKQLGKARMKFPATSELVVTIHFEGEKINDAVSYGKIKFDKAADDAGGDLKPEKKKEMFSFGSDDDKFKPLREGRMGMKQAKDEKGFRVELSLAPSSRKAAKISQLKGSLQVLAGGEKKTATVKKLKSLIGKQVEDPNLKAAGLEIKILDPEKQKGGFFSGGPNSLPMEIKGNLNALQEFEILDASGEDVSSGHMSSGSDNKKTYIYDLDQPLDDTIVVKVELMVGLETITVPFDLKDIELP